jgi:hypothetical protein
VQRTNPCPLYPPKADIDGELFDVRFAPIADIGAPLFNHLVGGGKKGPRYCEAERTCSF